MVVTMYSFAPLSDDERSDWEFPEWPYTEDEEEFANFKLFLTNRAIFSYQDDVKLGVDGKEDYRIMFPVVGELPEDTTMYMHTLVVDDDTMVVKQWPKNRLNPRNPKYKSYRRLVDHYGDEAAWEIFNLVGTGNVDFENGLVQFHPAVSAMSTTQQPKCSDNKGKFT